MTTLTQRQLLPTQKTAIPAEKKLEGFDVVRVLLGLVLLAAAGLKSWQLATEPTIEQSLFTSRWFMILEVEFEIFFGLLLLSGLYRRQVWLAALGCFALFSLVTLYKGLTGEASCGCFGKVEIHPWYTLIFDLAVIAALLIFRPGVTGDPFRIRWRPTAVVAVLTVAIGLPAAFAMASYTPTTLTEDGFIQGHGNFVVLEPEKWIGKPFPLIPFIDIGDQLKEGNWLVLLHNHSCPSCAEALEKFKQMASDLRGNKDFLRFALIEAPPYGKDASRDYKRYLYGRITDAKQWVYIAPTAMVIKDRKVVSVWEKQWPELDCIIQAALAL